MPTHTAMTHARTRLLAATLGLASQLPAAAQSPDSLRLQAFAQGRAKNCISVALIKAAIQRYGAGQVFDTLRTATGQLRVTLRDHTVLLLTAAERQQAARAACFKQPAPAGLPLAEQATLVRYATLCYAVLAKYVQTQHVWGCTSDTGQPAVYDGLGSYRRALRRLGGTSLCSDNAYRHLGLSPTAATAQAPSYTPTSLQAGRGAVAYNHGHAVFVLGRRYDQYGTWQPLATTAQADHDTFAPLWYFELE